MGNLAEKTGQEGRWVRALACLMLMGALGLTLPGEGDAVAQGAKVVEVPKFSYEVAQVYFKEPRNVSTGAGNISVREMVKVVVRGQGFRPMATGPVVWLNGIRTLRTQVAEDGTAVEAWFPESLQALDAAAAKLGKWELLYQPHEGANEVYRISPTGDPADAESRPAITNLYQ
jgi:hypothetical protein